MIASAAAVTERLENHDFVRQNRQGVVAADVGTKPAVITEGFVDERYFYRDIDGFIPFRLEKQMAVGFLDVAIGIYYFPAAPGQKKGEVGCHRRLARSSFAAGNCNIQNLIVPLLFSCHFGPALGAVHFIARDALLVGDFLAA